MADSKITDLTADTSPSTDDLIVTVDNPGGTPANKKVTLASVKAMGMLNCKTLLTTFDLSTASGNVAYTGVGFQPTGIVAIYGVDGGGIMGMGIGDASAGTGDGYVSKDNAHAVHAFTYLIGAVIDGSNYQHGDLNSLDADGFTIAWTKTGSPTGTLTMKFLCFR